MRILFVERLPSLRLVNAFGSHTMIKRSTSVDDALWLLRCDAFDVMVIDLAGLPENESAFIIRLRLAGHELPAVVLTGSDPADRVRAFEAGANDAVALPIDDAELCARVEAVVRRHNLYAHPILQIGDLSLSQVDRRVSFVGKPVPVTNNEYAILELLVLRRGSVVTREMFLTRLYSGLDEPEIKIIDVFICKLRRKLAAVGATGVIDMIWGRGYIIRAIGNDAPMSERDRLSA